jgi:rhodanese-related sulfurtransferase
MRLFKLVAVSFIFAIALSIGAIAAAQDVSRMDKDELKAMLDNPDLVIVDVRSGRDWSSSESKITGAVREEPRNAASWADKYQKDKTLVLYCA